MHLWTLTLFVPNREACRDFYVRHLNLKVVEETPRFVMLAGERGSRLAFHDGEPVSEPERVQLHFMVDDIEAEYARLAAAGVAFSQPPTLMPWGLRVATTADPAGHTVELVQESDATR